MITQSQYNRLLQFYNDNYQGLSQTNLYFCDSNKRIITQRAMLRCRLVQYITSQREILSTSFMCFKIFIDGNLYEYEKENCTIDDEELHTLLAKYNLYPPFFKVATAHTNRRLIDLPNAQLCLDSTSFNESEIVDYEIEYELKEHCDSNVALMEFMEILAKAAIEYIPNHQSKFQRALANTISI